MHRYSPYLMAIDPTRTQVPVRMLPLSFAAVLLLRTEPQALQTFLATQNSLPSRVLRPALSSLLSADAADLCKLAQELAGPPSMMRIARRQETLRLFAARVLLASALEKAPPDIRAMRVSPFLFLCPSADERGSRDPISPAVRVWLGKVWAEATISKSTFPILTAATLADIVISKARSVSWSFS